MHRLPIDSFIPLSKKPTAMFEVSSLHVNTCLQTLSPLADSSVYNILLQTAPNVNQSLLEFIDMVDLRPYTMLHDSPYLVFGGVQVRTVRGHSSGEMKSGVSRCRSLIASRAGCAALLKDKIVTCNVFDSR